MSMGFPVGQNPGFGTKYATTTGITGTIVGDTRRQGVFGPWGIAQKTYSIKVETDTPGVHLPLGTETYTAFGAADKVATLTGHFVGGASTLDYVRYWDNVGLTGPRLHVDWTYTVSDGLSTYYDIIGAIAKRNAHYNAGTGGDYAHDRERYEKIKLFPKVKGCATWHSFAFNDYATYEAGGTWTLTTPTATAQHSLTAITEYIPDAPTVDTGVNDGTGTIVVFWFGKLVADLVWPVTLVESTLVF